jgi:hypothetical protein
MTARRTCCGRLPRIAQGVTGGQEHRVAVGSSTIAEHCLEDDKSGRLTLRVIRDALASLVEGRSIDANLYYLNGTVLFSEADAAIHPLPDALHPRHSEPSTHRRTLRRLRLLTGRAIRRAIRKVWSKHPHSCCVGKDLAGSLPASASGVERGGDGDRAPDGDRGASADHRKTAQEQPRSEPGVRVPHGCSRRSPAPTRRPHSHVSRRCHSDVGLVVLVHELKSESARR